MAFDAFLKLDGIDGDSNANGHENEIELQSFSWGETNSGTAGGGAGGGGGLTAFQDFQFTMLSGKPATQLFLKCANGTHISHAHVTLRTEAAIKGGGLEFLKMHLEGIVVTNFQQAGAADGADRPTEEVALNFNRVTLETFDNSGQTGSASWDIQNNSSG